MEDCGELQPLNLCRTSHTGRTSTLGTQDAPSAMHSHLTKLAHSQSLQQYYVPCDMEPHNEWQEIVDLSFCSLKKCADLAIRDFQSLGKTKLPRGPGASTQGESNPGQKGLRDRNSPTCTLSQNGYGAAPEPKCTSARFNRELAMNSQS